MYRILILFTFLEIFSIHAQQEPILDQFWNGYSYQNPATTAMDYKLHSTVQYKSSFKGDSDALLGTFGFAINNKHSIGFNYLSTPSGKNKSFSINTGNLNYNYKFHFSDSITHFLSVGIGIGIGYVERYHNYGYLIPVSSQSSFLYPSSYTSYSFFPKLNVGITYRFKNLFFGTGVTQLTKNFLAKTTGTNHYQPNPMLYVMSSLDIKIVNNLRLKPQILFNYINENYYYTHANLMITLFKNYAIGGSYWFGNPVYFTGNNDIIGGLKIRNDFQLFTQADIKSKFRIGYSIGMLNAFPNVTHEFVLGFQLK